MATRIPCNTEPSEFLLEAVREGAEFTLYRAREHGNPSPLLVIAPTAEQPLPLSLRRLEHEFSLAAELDPDLITMENGPNLEKQKVFRSFVSKLKKLGFHVTHEVVDCSDFGVPQQRHRLVLI